MREQGLRTLLWVLWPYKSNLSFSFSTCTTGMTNLDSVLKSRDITLTTKVHLVKAMVFSSSHVWMWVLDHKEGWVPKNWCFQTVVLEKTLESPLDCKEINPEYSLEDWYWSWSFSALTTWCEEPTYWRRSWCWERLRAGGEGVDRGWDGGIASSTEWTWVWANSRRW